MSITFYVGRETQTADGHRQVNYIDLQDGEDYPNMANETAAVLLSIILDRKVDLWDGSELRKSDFRKVRGRLMQIMTDDTLLTKYVSEPSSDGNFHDCGIPLERIQRKLREFFQLLNIADRFDDTIIYWG